MNTIKQLRQKMGLTQVELAKELNISQGSTCDELLTGETKIISDENTSRLIEIYNSLSWDGQQMVIAKAVEEKRYESEALSPLSRAR